MPTRPLLRIAVMVVALSCIAVLPATADIRGDAALPDDAVEAQRIAGQDRYYTAGRTAISAYPDGADVAVLARGDEFPDGLAASYLAGVLDAPILLTPPQRLEFTVQEAFDRLGTRRVVIVGGTNAINRNVEDALRERFGDANVDRVSGIDRFQTAAVIYQQTGTAGRLTDLSGDSDRRLRTAVLASGENFPDALAAGPLAHAAGVPILLTQRDRLPDVTRFALDSGIEQVLIAGGPRTITDQVRAQVAALSDVEVVQRVSGADRTETAARLAQLTREQLGWPGETATVALGAAFPDALSLAPAASRFQAPILLTASTSSAGAPTFTALQEQCATLAELVISGGQAAIDVDAERQLELATSCADMTAELTPEAEVEPGDRGASDAAWVWLDSLCYAVRVQGLSTPATAAHVHEGAADEAGDVVATLEVPDPPEGISLSVGCLTDDDVEGSAEGLRSGLRDDPAAYYVNVHSEGHPEGAVRGQLTERS
jgi:putative cell wall-binding protein